MKGEEKIYLQDPYLTGFTARVDRAEDISDSESIVVLDRTAFYPESGGQPHDTGTLDGRKVTAVRESGGRVEHVVEGRLGEGKKVTGVVDFSRRFDHMQQHTGQHLLSRVFLDIAGLDTAGFHMGESASTIDLEGPAPSGDVMERVELEVNRLIYKDIPVTARSLKRDEFRRICEEKGYHPRSEPPGGAEIVRLVEVEGVDINACCGTHTSKTGEIGVIKITATERVRDNTRVEFLCGFRALRDYLEKDRIISSVAGFFSTSHAEIGEVVQKLTEENKRLKKELKSVREEVASSRAGRIGPDGEIAGRSLVKKQLEGVDPGLLGKMAGEMRDRGVEIIMLGVGGESPALVFACSPEIDLNMAEILKEAGAVMNARGGGTRDFARGGGGDGGRLKETLDRGEDLVRERLEQG
ncbi:MAG: DHHA1 domain-containing protein [Candidatus Krumholzibacteriales bacterium]